MKKLLAVLLCLVMMLSLLPAAALADGEIPEGYYLVGTKTGWQIDQSLKFAPYDGSIYYLATTMTYVDENNRDEFKVIHVLADGTQQWIPDPGDNYKCYFSGTRYIYLDTNGNHSGWHAGYYHAVQEPFVNGYYLVGSFNSWTASADYELTSANQYSITRNLSASDEFKVLKRYYGVDTYYPENNLTGYTGDQVISFDPNTNIVSVTAAASPISVEVYVDSSLSNGTVTADKSVASPGDTLVLTIAPDDGYCLDTLEYCWSNSGYTTIPVSGNSVNFVVPQPTGEPSHIFFTATFIRDFSGETYSITLKNNYDNTTYTYSTPTTPINSSFVREEFYVWGDDVMFYLPYPNPFDANAPAGAYFSRWEDQDGNTCMYFTNPVDSTGSITMTEHTMTVTAIYSVPTYTTNFPSSVTVVPGTTWTDCPLNFSELVFGGQADSMVVHCETGETLTNSSIGTLTKTGSTETIPFKLGMQDIPHVETDECYAVSWQTQSSNFYSTDDTRYLGVYIDQADLADAEPGVYTGSIHWRLDFGNQAHEEGTIPITLTIPDPSEPEFTNHALVLSGQIGVQFFLTLPEGKTPADYPDSYVTFVDHDNKFDGTTHYALSAATQMQGMYMFTAYVNAAMLADEIVPTFHYTVNDEEKTVVGDAYSAQAYIIEAESKTLDANVTAVIHALADYGYHAQQYLSEYNGWAIGIKYTEQTKVYTTSFDYDAVKTAVAPYSVQKDLVDTEIEKVTFKLNLDDTINLTVYLKPVSGATVSSVTVDGVEKTPELVGSQYVVKFENIKASALTNSHTIVTSGGSRVTIWVSSYIYSMLNTSGHERGKNVVCALQAYATACAALSASN